MIGRIISHYKIKEKIGEGGMGEVYLAEDTKLKRDVALKILPSGTGVDSDHARFIMEAQAAGSLNHPNVCVIHEIIDDYDPPCIVMEYVQGQTLQNLINQNKSHHLKIDLILRYASSIAAALSAAHQKQIIHRDIKSDNIMVTSDDQVKIMDFGLAKLKGQANITKSASTVGTIAYMAPEQIEGKNVDERSDIFSFGVVLYETISGKKPFPGDYEAAILYAIINDEPEPLSDIRNDIPAELINIVSRALKKNPDERYQSMEELLNDLQGMKSEAVKFSTAPGRNNRHEPIEQRKILFKNSKLVFGFSALIIIIIAFILFQFLKPDNNKIDTLAILPFVNTTGDKDTEYLSDGIPESIISNLQKIPDLRVASFHSVLYRYKDKEYDPAIVGDELDVASVAMGRLTLHGDNVSINIEIVDTRDNSVILAKQYIENLANIFEIQTKIAQDITSNLQLELAGKEKHTLIAPKPTTAEAYQDYLRGRHFMKKRNPGDFEKAIAYFKSAVKKDPNYALAYSGLADTYRLQEQYGGVPAYRTTLNARKAAEKAILLDSLSAEVQTSMGGVFLTAGKLSEAKKRFIKAIDLNPNYILAYHWLGLTQQRLGESRDEIKVYEMALKIDPLSYIISGNLANAYTQAGQIEKALDLHLKNIKLFPDQAAVFRAYSYTLLNMGENEKSIQMMQKSYSLDSLSYWSNINISVLYHRLQDYEKSIAYCKKMMNQNPDFLFGALIVMGMNYRALGEHRKAIESYQKAIDLDPLATEPHDFLGDYFIKIGEYEKALEQFKENTELSPEDPRTFGAYSIALTTMGRYREAIRQIKNSVAIDQTWNDYLGLIYYFSGDYEKAKQTFQDGLRLYPKNKFAPLYFAILYFSEEEFKNCADYFDMFLSLSEFPDHEKLYSESFVNDEFTKATVQKYLCSIGDKIISDKIPGYAMHQAAIFAMCGNKERMLEYLNKSYNRPVTEDIVWVTAPIFKPYYSDPDFTAFFKKLNLDKYHSLN